MIGVQLDEDTGMRLTTDRMTAVGDETVRALAGGSYEVNYEFVEPSDAVGFEFAADDHTKHGASMIPQAGI